MNLGELRELVEIHLILVGQDACVTTSDDPHGWEPGETMGESLEGLASERDTIAGGFSRYRTGGGGANFKPDERPMGEVYAIEISRGENADIHSSVAPQGVISPHQAEKHLPPPSSGIGDKQDALEQEAK